MRLLLVDDDPEIHDFVRGVLPKGEFEVETHPSAESAWRTFDQDSQKPRLALIDWFLPGMSGPQLIEKIRSRPDGKNFHLILFTAHHNQESLSKVLECGANDYLTKPLDLATFRIRMSLAKGQTEKLIQTLELEKTLEGLKTKILEEARFHDLIGQSKQMLQVYTLIREMAKVDISVLIQGETGSGKELVAKAIHNESHRKQGPFIAINCGGLSENLIASQLFGHKRGSFTGAVSDHKGVFEAAAGGTLFLDEIGDLPLNLQANFLRVLETREVTPIGATQSRPVNVRVVAATHQPLDEMVGQNTFRGDLLYRIKVGRVTLPPLRERTGDIPYLVKFFLDRGVPLLDKKVAKCSDDAMIHLLNYHWPGNVRELKNVMELAQLRCRTGKIESQDLPVELILEKPQTTTKTTPFETQLTAALEQTNGNVKKAAEIMGMSRATLYRKVKKHGIQLH